MKLKQLREAAQMTQAEVAARLRIDRSAIAHWEQGRNGPNKRILPRVAELYRCSVEDLLGGSGKPPMATDERGKDNGNDGIP